MPFTKKRFTKKRKHFKRKGVLTSSAKSANSQRAMILYNKPKFFKIALPFEGLSAVQVAQSVNVSHSNTVGGVRITMPAIGSGGYGTDMATSYISFQVTHQFIDVQASARLSAVFDRYKIRAIKRRIIMTTNTSLNGIGGTIVPQPALSICDYVDRNDNSLPSPDPTGWYLSLGWKDSRSQPLIQQRSAIKRYYIPRQNIIATTAPLAVGGGIVMKPQWLDSNANTIAHFGDIFMIQMVNLQPTPYEIVLEVLYDYYMGFDDELV